MVQHFQQHYLISGTSNSGTSNSGTSKRHALTDWYYEQCTVHSTAAVVCLPIGFFGIHPVFVPKIEAVLGIGRSLD